MVYWCPDTKKTNKPPHSPGEGSRSWSWYHLAPEGTLPAGHSSLSRVWTYPNRNQNLSHCTDTQLPSHLLPPAFALWWLNTLFFKGQPKHHNSLSSPSSTDPSTAILSFFKTTSFARFLHSVLSWGRQILLQHLPATNSSWKPLWFCDISIRKFLLPGWVVTLHLHNPTISDTASKLLKYRGTGYKGISSWPSAFQLCFARVSNWWMMTPIKRPLCSDRDHKYESFLTSSLHALEALTHNFTHSSCKRSLDGEALPSGAKRSLHWDVLFFKHPPQIPWMALEAR